MSVQIQDIPMPCGRRVRALLSWSNFYASFEKGFQEHSTENLILGAQRARQLYHRTEPVHGRPRTSGRSFGRRPGSWLELELVAPLFLCIFRVCRVGPLAISDDSVTAATYQDTRSVP